MVIKEILLLGNPQLYKIYIPIEKHEIPFSQQKYIT